MSNTNATRVKGVEGVDICRHCGGPVAYLDTREAHIDARDNKPDAICERCAQRDSARDAGLIVAGLNALATAVQILEEGGMTHREIASAVTDGAGDEDMMDLDPAGVPSWACGFLLRDTKYGDDRFVPIDGGEAR